MKEELAQLAAAGNLRKLTPSHQEEGTIWIDGKPYINLSSNDYLGISARTDWQSEFLTSLPPNQYWMGATSSRLLTGNHEVKEELESFIGEQYGKACLVYNSGYHTNVGILPTITTAKDFVIADKLAHASIIDGLRLSACAWTRYRHNDYQHLESILKKNKGKYERVIVVTESVFSMDGDFADLHELVALKHQYGFQIYLDEAHAVGVFGVRGLGLAEELNLLSEVDYLVGTFSKALASEGGFVLTTDTVKRYLINKSRSLIFTTAGTPITSLWNLFVFKRMLQMGCERSYLQDISAQFSELLCGKTTARTSQIIPWLFSDNATCLACCKQLQDAGLWVSPIRYPSVPMNKPRIRLSLTAALAAAQIQKIYEVLLVYQKG